MNGIAWMTLFVLLWAFIETLAAGVLTRHSPFQVVWTRYGVHLLLMVLYVGSRDGARRLPTLWRTRRPTIQVARSLLMLGMPASWAIAWRLGVDTTTTMAIFWASPLLVLAFARAVLGEVVPRFVWGATALACAGAWTLLGVGMLPQPWLLILPVTMAGTFSLYVVMTRSLREEPLRANLFHTALAVFVSLTPLMFRVGRMPSPRDGLVMIAVGALGLAALWALDRAVADAPVWAVGTAIALELPFAVAFGWLAGHHGLTRSALIGGALIVLAVLVVAMFVRRRTMRDAGSGDAPRRRAPLFVSPDPTPRRVL